MQKKIVVIGGTGLIGAKLVRLLNAQGHQAVAASPRSGVNTLTGEGLAQALQGASVIVDVSNSPSFEERAVMEFFRASTQNLLRYGAQAGVAHFVALSIVGTQGLPANPYFRAKIVQENLMAAGPIPYTIVQATQFFEFVKSIADFSTVDGQVRVPDAAIQPIAGDEVAALVGRIALEPPLNGTVEIAGPRRFRFEELIRLALAGGNDPREIVVDPKAFYFGAPLEDRSLVPREGALLGTKQYEEWLGAAMTKL